MEFDIAVTPDDEQSRVRCGTEKMAQEEERRFVGPVQVVEDHQRRLYCSHPRDQGSDRLEKAVALGFGISSNGALRHAAMQFRKHPNEILLEAMEALVQRRRRVHRDTRSQRFDERLKRNDHLFITPPVEHDATLSLHPAREFDRESGLADAGLPGDEGDLSDPVLRPAPRRRQPIELNVAAGQCFDTAGERRSR